MADSRRLLVILGNQLVAPRYLQDCRGATVFMAEDMGLCTYVKHHQQKIVLFLSAMRAYADELRRSGFDVRYHELDPDRDPGYESRLGNAVKEAGAVELIHFEIEDKAMERRIVEFADESGLRRTELQSPLFLCSRRSFAEFAKGGPPLQMADFYRSQRESLGVLVDEKGRPVGERWSFDKENRKKLPRKLVPPEAPAGTTGPHVSDVVAMVERHFSDHPGRARDFWWPDTREGAQEWLERFLDDRLMQFGPYEDAITTRSDTVFHSLLSPLLNIGLLTPREVLDAVLERAEEAQIPLPSVEGFVRQLIGWREFVRGIYRHYSDEQDAGNFWKHQRELTPHWHDGTTGIPPLDDAIRSTARLAWSHHIRRLMVVGNLMNLCEIRPRTVHDWFMEMFIDSSEWVMGPNVYGMALYSDGGMFATKPYLCGSNYLLKMSDYRKGDWCDAVDGLYWRFIDRHRDFFAGNPRLSFMPASFDRLDAARKRRILDAAESFLERFTRSA